MEQATFAAGCFWGIEAEFRQLPGIQEAAVGYTGGSTAAPTYEQVCTGTTGHAEAVQITFDPAQISYAKLLEVFWQCHDPTQRNRQAPPGRNRIAGNRRDEGSEGRNGPVADHTPPFEFEVRLEGERVGVIAVDNDPHGGLRPVGASRVAGAR